MSLLGRLLALWAVWRRVLRGRPPRRPLEDPDPREREIPADARAELLAAVLLFVATGFAIAFIVLYVVYPNTPLLGATAGLALVSLAVALMLASLRVVPQVTEVEERHPFGDAHEEHEVALDVRDGFEGISRRRLLTTAAGVCGCGLTAAALTPAASLGPRIRHRLADTPWHAGRLLVDEDDRPISADDLEVRGFLTAFPQGADKRDLGSPVVVVRIDPADLHLSAARRNWAPEGYLAYSKICTHAGCAVSEFRTPLSATTKPAGPALVCPCHYSTFDVTRGGAVLFGPAGRPLPQLPLAIDARRQLRAAGPLSDPPGPSWFGVGRTHA